jgi:predicted dehydrogenase
MTKRKYAIVGISGRSQVFTKAILNYYGDTSEIVALVDRNPARMEEFNSAHETRIPCYRDVEFEKMVEETAPDAVIVCTNDVTHHAYIIAALEHGLDAITEKPMTIDEEKANAILEAEKNSKGRVVVTFNFRYTPIISKIKELIAEGRLGRVTDINFSHCLDTFHGWAYFKRWNRYMEQSGGLLVTKSCHHFDTVNWWLQDAPREVFAMGGLVNYGAGSEKNPAAVDGRRCSTCDRKCAYYKRHAIPGGKAEPYNLQLFSLNNPGKNDAFGAVDGYYADRCCFDSDIDTLDMFSVMVRYGKGTVLNYTLNASAAYSSTKITINGTGGRVEVDMIDGGERPGRLPFAKPDVPVIKYYPLFDGMQTINVISKGGGHGGADSLLTEELFSPESDHADLDSLGADAGAMSVLIGAAANKSIKNGVPVRIKGFELL